MPSLFFEDFEPGRVVPYGGATVDRDAMVAFARVYDPQPMHLDEEAAKASMVGALIASGWYTAALNMRMMCDDFMLAAAGMGSPGVSELKWLKPVRAGDRLTGTREVLDRRPSASKPDRGFVNFRFRLANQHGEPVFEQINLVMLARRTREPMADSASAPFGGPPVTLPAFTDVTRDDLPFAEDLAVGERITLGVATFDADGIIRFARDFDPQSFHIDPEAARASIFGGLIASGWQTAGTWMGLMAKSRMAAAKAMLAAGQRPARLGPSPGFRNLRWIRPVHAGDRLTYTSGIVEVRMSASRPGWAIVTHHNSARNQKDEEVFAFTGAVFWERRPA
jgi:acyl dehydratase